MRRVQRSVFGQFINVTACDRCRGEGWVIPTPCTHCRGTGRERVTRTLEVKVPAGVDNGSQIRLTGEGELGTYGGPRGNAYVVLHVAEHAIFERDEDDLHLQLNISFVQAALGDEVECRRSRAKQKLKVAAGTESGEVLTLRNKGIAAPARRRPRRPARPRPGDDAEEADARAEEAAGAAGGVAGEARGRQGAVREGTRGVFVVRSFQFAVSVFSPAHQERIEWRGVDLTPLSERVYDYRAPLSALQERGCGRRRVGVRMRCLRKTMRLRSFAVAERLGQDDRFGAVARAKGRFRGCGVFALVQNGAFS